jgi:hypothetical protein
MSAGQNDGSGQEPSLANVKLSQIQSNARGDAAINTQITMQAVLCWSEYYNGKWQATKTSDLNRPTSLGPFAAAGTDAFDRAALRLSVSEEGQALRVLLNGQGAASFLLYNTHSLPVRGEDDTTIVHAPPPSFGPLRTLDTSGQTFTANYYMGGPVLRLMLSRPMLISPIAVTVTEPLHALRNVWDAPFFYEDRRHVFYVTTAEQQVRVPDYPDYGVTVNPAAGQAARIPPLVPGASPSAQAGPGLAGDGRSAPQHVDRAPRWRFVTEDAFVPQGIGTSGRVRYGDRQIGPAGAIDDGHAEL